jgi:hypothetical protein
MSEPARHLQAVEEAPDEPLPYRIFDLEGAELDECPGCRKRDRIIDAGTLENEGLVETTRGQAAKIRELRRDKEREMRASDLWPQALELVAYWAIETGRKKGRTKLTPKRFEMLEPFLKPDKETGADGLAMCKLAIDGAAYDPYKADRPNKNGTLEVYDSLETIFKNRGAFERHVNRAPRERLRAVNESGGFGEAFTDADVRIKAEVMLAMEGGYELEGDALRMATAGALERARQELEGKKTPDRKQA